MIGFIVEVDFNIKVLKRIDIDNIFGPASHFLVFDKIGNTYKGDFKITIMPCQPLSNSTKSIKSSLKIILILSLSL